MATIRWLGTAAAVAQESRATPATVETGDIFTLTINAKSISFTATAATVANVTAGLVAAWNASTIAEFAEVTASDQTTYVKLLADTAGKPFTCTSSTTDGGGAATQTLTMTTPTAAAGPNFWSGATNWSTGAVPVNSDDVVLDQGSVDILYGLDQSAVTLTSLTRQPTYTGKIGLPEVNADATDTYYEYRDTYLKIGATTVTDYGGGGRFKLNTGTVQTALIVKGFGARIEAGIPVFIWKGTHASSTLSVQKGDVGVAFYGGESATLLTISVGYLLSVTGDSRVVLGSGTTLTSATITQTGGNLEINSASTGTITLYNGTLTINSGAQSQLNLYGGECRYNSNGTLGGNTVVAATAFLTFDQDSRTKTITNQLELYGDKARISDRNRVVTNPVVDLNQGAKASQVDWGPNVRLTRALL